MLERARKSLSTFLSRILIPSECAHRQLLIQLGFLFKTALQKQSPDIPPRCERAVYVQNESFLAMCLSQSVTGKNSGGSTTNLRADLVVRSMRTDFSDLRND